MNDVERVTRMDNEYNGNRECKSDNSKQYFRNAKTHIPCAKHRAARQNHKKSLFSARLKRCSPHHIATADGKKYKKRVLKISKNVIYTQLINYGTFNDFLPLSDIN